MSTFEITHKSDNDKVFSAIQEFAFEFRRHPTFWMKEIDYQCELYSRLVEKFRGETIRNIEHTEYQKQCDINKGISVRRVSCEPNIPGLHYQSYPDIVVWRNKAEQDRDLLKWTNLKPQFIIEIKQRFGSEDYKSTMDYEKYKGELSESADHIILLDFVTKSKGENKPDGLSTDWKKIVDPADLLYYKFR
ncbi:MAG: hypothetical protein HUU10_12825 [Bacteroidetes bacterium]|nr:hypothetical protein [Bacteroidota bacterium]